MGRMFQSNQLDDRTESLLMECAYGPFQPHTSVQKNMNIPRPKIIIPKHLRKDYPKSAIKSKKVIF